MLGHAAGLYEDLTIEENVRFWARAARSQVDPATAQDRAGVAPRLRAVPVGRLSAGQRRRAALAALLVRDAALWLLDEPHAGLDADGRDLLDQLVREASASGVTVLLASHELDRASLLAGRQVVVVGGHTEPTPEALDVA
jgi:ABC-type transport system involved in cytochrome c biogenesis ATPase subunit